MIEWLERLEELRNFKPGWDGPGSTIPREDIFNKAARFISLIKELDICFISMSSNVIFIYLENDIEVNISSTDIDIYTNRYEPIYEGNNLNKAAENLIYVLSGS
jgi:hypothetical protein